MRANNTHLLQVQLTEAEKRDIKTLAASQGLTLRQATLRAFEAWASQLRSPAPAAIPARGTNGADLAEAGPGEAGCDTLQRQSPGRRAECLPSQNRGRGDAILSRNALGRWCRIGFDGQPASSPGCLFASLASPGGAAGLVKVSGGAEGAGKNR